MRRRLKTLLQKVKALLHRSKTAKVIVLVGTASAAGAVCYAIGGVAAAAVAPVVVAIHEFGHALMGIRGGGNWHWSVVIPIGILVIGVTKISGVAATIRSKMYRAGPVAGLVAALILVAVGMVFCLYDMVILAVVAAGLELYQLTLGRDARQARRYACP